MKHNLTHHPDKTYTCALCQWSWKRPPVSSCPGVPRYRYGQWPEHLYTFTQLRRMKRKPINGPAGCYFLMHDPYKRYLYDIHQSIPRRVPSERQREAIRKMRAALVVASTCKRCGFYDRSHGRTKRDLSVKSGYCENCWDEIRQEQREAEACAWAAAYLCFPADILILDTETTGLAAESDEVIELAMITGTGCVLVSSLIKPQDPKREDLATHIHGITPQMLRDAPTFPEVWPTVKAILRRYRHRMVYNAPFDKRLLAATAKRYGYRVPGGAWACVMQQYARYHGEWSSYYRSFTWQQLQVACATLGVQVESASHRALGDAFATLGVLRALATLHDQAQQEKGGNSNE